MTIPQNVPSWLDLPALCEVNYGTLRKRIVAASKLAGVKLEPDVFRHSFASHHLALHQNAALTAHELGHRGQDVLFRHYADRVTKEEGREYFKVQR